MVLLGPDGSERPGIRAQKRGGERGRGRDRGTEEKEAIQKEDYREENGPGTLDSMGRLVF